MSDFTPRLLSDADAAADLAGVPRPVSDDATKLADALDSADPNFYAESSLWFDSKLSDLVCDSANMLRNLVSERGALAGRVAELEAERDAAAKTACGAVRKAFSLGQTYWQQADSEYTSQHRKAEDTWATFKALIEETRAAINVPKGGM